MKKLMYWVGGVLVLLVVIGFLARGYLGMIAMTLFMEPDQAYSLDTVPEAPDYGNEAHWAALPDRTDSADVTPAPDVADNQVTAAVDVFFVHPTTYVSSAGWNQPMDDAAANKGTDEWVMRDQASVFNGCCKVYAPRYRQATLYSFQDQSGSGEKALDLAYGDVKQAFTYFLEHYNQGRPFILASHSQGSKHLDRLLEEEVASTDLLSRMVAAYPVGFSIDGSNGVSVCQQSGQINCQVSWNANTADAAVKLGRPGDVCVNPLSWQADEQLVSVSGNLGSVTFSSEGGIDKDLADAQCVDGSLVVTEVTSERYANTPFGPGNYHMYDYSFYYMNIRENLEERVAGYQSANALSESQ
jgi:hypothetical protein